METVQTSEPVRKSSDELYLLVNVADQTCGLPVSTVREIIQSPAPSVIPGSPAYVRGVVNIRGQILTLVDLRLRLGYTSAKAEQQALVAALKQREKEHKGWMLELENSVKEGRPFTLATNPHACAFGKWYDNFQAPNPMLAYHLTKFDSPHKSIHGLAKSTQALLNSEGKEAALKAIENGRATILNRMLILFHELYAMIDQSAREISVVMEVDGHTFAVVVDGVDALERLDEPAAHSSGQPAAKPDLFETLCFRQQKKVVVPLIDMKRLSRELRGISPGITGKPS